MTFEKLQQVAAEIHEEPFEEKWSWSQIYDQIRKGQRKECVGTSEASRRNKPTEKGVRTIIMYKEILRIEKPR